MQPLAPPTLPLLLAAILALGAVSQGCATGLAPFLPEMVAMLLPTRQDPRPMVRCIRCALTRLHRFFGPLHQVRTALTDLQRVLRPYWPK